MDLFALRTVTVRVAREVACRFIDFRYSKYDLSALEARASARHLSRYTVKRVPFSSSNVLK